MELINGISQRKAAEQTARLAEQQRKAGVQLLNELDWQPMYASERVPTYQRNPSAARDYLDSFLMGNNPDAISPVSPNAAMKKQQAQAQQNAMFGTPQQRIANERNYFASQPWKVTPPTRPVVQAPAGTVPGSAEWTAGHPELAAKGINKRLSDALESGGTNLDAMGTLATTGKRRFNDIANYQGTTDVLQGILHDYYNGDADAFAADLKAAGSLENLEKQFKATGRKPNR